MPKSWIRLLVVGLISLVVLTGYEVFMSLTGRTQDKEYSVTEIEGSFDQEVLTFLEGKRGEVIVHEEDL